MSFVSSTQKTQQQNLQQEVYELQQYYNTLVLASCIRLEDSEANLRYLEKERSKLAKKIHSLENSSLHRILKTVSTVAFVVFLSFCMTILCSTPTNIKSLEDGFEFLKFFIPKWLQKLDPPSQ